MRRGREDPERVERPVPEPGPSDDRAHRDRCRTPGSRPTSRGGRPSRTARPSGTTQRSWPGATVGWAWPSRANRYGSSSFVPLTETDPSSLTSTVSPATPITRLMYGVPSACCVQDGRRVEDDDVAPVVRAEMGGQLVDEDVLLGLERVLHRLLLDAVRLSDEVLDDEEDERGSGRASRRSRRDSPRGVDSQGRQYRGARPAQARWVTRPTPSGRVRRRVRTATA